MQPHGAECLAPTGVTLSTLEPLLVPLAQSLSGGAHAGSLIQFVDCAFVCWILVRVLLEETSTQNDEVGPCFHI